MKASPKPRKSYTGLGNAAENIAQIASIIHWSDDAIIGKALDGTITSWNRGAERTYGFTADEAIGKPIDIILPPNRSTEMQSIVARIRRGERIEHYETERLHKDGRVLDVSLTVSPMVAESGEIIGISSIGREITGARQASHYVRSLIEASLDPLVTISSEGKITDVNEATIRVTGVPRQMLVGTDFSNYFTEPDKAREGYKEVFAKGLVTDYPLTIRHKEGRLTDVLYNASVYKDIRGNVLGVFAAARDVTASKRAEQKFQALIEAAPDAMIMVNRQGKIMLVNGQTERSFGYTRVELLGKSIEQLVPERFHAQHRGHRLSFFDKPIPRPMGAGLDLWGRRKDGTEFPIELSLSPIETDEGTHVTATIRDITLQKQASHYVRSLIEASLDPLVTISSEGKITDVNEATIRVTGVPRQMLVGTDFSNYFTEPDKAREGYKEVFAKGLVTDYPLTIRHKEGRLTDVLYNASVYKDIRGNVLGVFAAARDVTVQRRTEVELVAARETALQASRAKSAFLATMSHEIRTPMNGVVGMIEILARSSLSERQTELVGTVRKSADTLLRIIDDILDFSKIEAGKLDLDLRPVSVADLVEGICTSLYSMASSKNVDLQTFIDSRVPRAVLADDVRLRQLLYNLAGNAIKFSGGQLDRRGKVSLRAAVSSDKPLRLTFDIADNGIGMSEETLTNLFVSFSQAEVSTTRRFGGTGLGLAISKRLVELMGGSISVTSTLGQGSAFTVTLPFEVAVAQPQSGLSDLSGIDCVLVAAGMPFDDVRAQLEHAGAQVHMAADMATAVKMAASLALPLLIRSATSEELDVLTQRPAFSNAPDARCLVLVLGARQCARLLSPMTVGLEMTALHRQTFVRAIAVAAGRLPAETLQELLPSDAIATHVPAPSIAQARAAGTLILVAEDDPINQKVIQLQLELLGYAVEVAGNGAEALQSWREGRYALLFTDLHMPEMDGYTLTRRIRNEESSTRRIPILALTANALRGEENRARDAGMDDYLVKPITLDRLKTALAKWLPDVNRARLDDLETPGQRRTPAASADNHRGAAVDISALESLIGRDPITLRHFLNDYLVSARQHAQQIRQAHAEIAPSLIATVCHKLKSSSRAVGALRFGDLCNDLENAGKVGDQDAIARHMIEFENAMVDVEEDIAVLLAKS